MNPKMKRITVQHCAICDYPFADRHHVYPQRRSVLFGVKKMGKITILLCPNHHRFANIAQEMTERCLQSGSNFEPVIEFGEKFFDDAFNKILWKLINAHTWEEQFVANELAGEYDQEAQ